MDYAGAAKLLFLLMILGGIGWGLTRVYAAGRRRQQIKQMEANQRAIENAFKESEEWADSGGMLGGIKLPRSDKDPD
jgi:hypothetical protein